jgi:hypothetical protein
LAQPDDGAAPIHWAYGAFFGTGRYKLSDDASVDVLRVQFRHDFMEPALEDGRRRPGVTLRVPMAAGHQGELPLGGDIPEFAAAVSTISVVPGIEFPVPIGEHWSIKPLASVGYGHALGSGDAAWIYRAGIRSEYKFATERFDWALTNALMILGFRDNNQVSQQAEPLTIGLEARIALKNRKIGDDPVFLHWHVARTHYLKEPILSGELAEPILALDGEWELGAAFSKGDSRVRLWKFGWDRVGFAIRMDSHGEFTGFRLNFRSLFDQ